MKKIGVLLMIVVALIVGTALAINFSPGKIPFPYDQNQIVGKKLGGVLIAATDFMIVDVNCTHPRNFPFVITMVSSPVGMYIINDVNDWHLQWTPDANQVGTWYIVLDATDNPPPPHKSKSRQGTLVIQVVELNPGPVFHPLEDTPVVVRSWPVDYQKRWQELRKQGTVMIGPVVLAL